MIAVVGGVAAVAAADIATKAFARGSLPAVNEDGIAQARRHAEFGMIHQEHVGTPASGFTILGATAVTAGAALYAAHRFGAHAGLAALGAAMFATGGALNGLELVERGSNTNPLRFRKSVFNVADLAIVSGVALLAASAIPLILRR